MWRQLGIVGLVMVGLAGEGVAHAQDSISAQLDELCRKSSEIPQPHNFSTDETWKTYYEATSAQLYCRGKTAEFLKSSRREEEERKAEAKSEVRTLFSTLSLMAAAFCAAAGIRMMFPPSIHRPHLFALSNAVENATYLTTQTKESATRLKDLVDAMKELRESLEKAPANAGAKSTNAEAAAQLKTIVKLRRLLKELSDQAKIGLDGVETHAANATKALDALDERTQAAVSSTKNASSHSVPHSRVGLLGLLGLFVAGAAAYFAHNLSGQ